MYGACGVCGSSVVASLLVKPISARTVRVRARAAVIAQCFSCVSSRSYFLHAFKMAAVFALDLGECPHYPKTKSAFLMLHFLQYSNLVKSNKTANDFVVAWGPQTYICQFLFTHRPVHDRTSGLPSTPQAQTTPCNIPQQSERIFFF